MTSWPHDAPPTTELPRRPRRANGKARYEHLLDAAETVLMRDGVEGLTIQALAVQAGAPMATVYHYFPGPLALPVALYERYSEGFFEIAAEPIDGREAMTWQEVITRLVERGVRYYRAHPYAQTLVLGSGQSWRIRMADLDGNRAMVPGIAEMLRDKLPPMPEEMLADIIFIGIGINDAVLAISVAESGTITDHYARQAALATCAYVAGRVGAHAGSVA